LGVRKFWGSGSTLQRSRKLPPKEWKKDRCM
jgi:hypothetical protein